MTVTQVSNKQKKLSLTKERVNHTIHQFFWLPPFRLNSRKKLYSEISGNFAFLCFLEVFQFYANFFFLSSFAYVNGKGYWGRVVGTYRMHYKMSSFVKKSFETSGSGSALLSSFKQIRQPLLVRNHSLLRVEYKIKINFRFKKKIIYVTGKPPSSMFHAIILHYQQSVFFLNIEIGLRFLKIRDFSVFWSYLVKSNNVSNFFMNGSS